MKQFWTLIICFLFAHVLHGQISHGGQPLFTPNSLLKSSASNFFIEMPSFDINKQRKEDELNKQNMRGSFHFAYKFYTDIERGKDGLNYQLSDGTKVWQVGIRSKDAYSINVLFSEFHIPEGGKLFLYNSSRTYVIGSFTSENNTETGVLPVRPVMGDEIIVEYSEPSNAAFEGKLKISEVNHDYINLLKLEPSTDQLIFACMPDVICKNANDPNIRSTLLLLINGTTACTGTLINNASNTGEPYVLTASHCLNNDFKAKSLDDYYKASGTVVSFFNYNRPICNLDFKIKGTEEMTLAGSVPVCIIDTCDIAMIRMDNTPPGYYMPYYAGWDITYNKNNNQQENAPFTNFHHPNSTMTKYGDFNQPVSLSTLFISNEIGFLPNSHWLVNHWDTGSTAPGSSGSPLFSNNSKLIGALSGGDSECTGSSPNGKGDYFFALFKGWTYGSNPLNQLKSSLDAANTGSTMVDGFDPYKQNPMVILSNTNYNATDSLVNTDVTPPATGSLFGHNSLQETTEFAEEFSTSKKAKLIGTYILAPAVDFRVATTIKINVYAGSLSPDHLIETTVFYPKYTNYKAGDTISSLRDTYRYPFQSFVKFENEQLVEGKFYIAYEISYPNPADNGFSVYNTIFEAGSAKKNTAWLKKSATGEWIPADRYTSQPMKTSLAIQAMINYGTGTGIELPTSQEQQVIRYDRNEHRLYISVEPNESGTIKIYTITGQLMEQHTFSGSSSLILQSPENATIGIVKVFSNKKQCSSKIIF